RRETCCARERSARVHHLVAGQSGQGVCRDLGRGWARAHRRRAIQKLSGTRFQFVPYRGMTPAMQDLVSGQIDLMIADPASAIPQFRAGRIKVFAVTGNTRLAAAPEIPTVDQAGLPGFYLAPWHGLWAPKGTPGAVILTLNAAVVDALADPAVRQRLVDLGSNTPAREEQTPQALRAFHKAEIQKWWPIIKAANIRAE